MVAKNAANKALVNLMLDAFVDQDQARADLARQPSDAAALKLFNRAQDIIEGVVKSFSLEALYQVQLAMDKSLHLDERPDGRSNTLDLDATDGPQEVVHLGIAEVGDLIWSLVVNAQYPDAKYFSLSADGALQFLKAPDYESAGQKNFNLLVKLADAQGHFVTQALTVQMGDVNEAPTAVAIAAHKIALGRAFSLDLASCFSDVDANDALTFTAEGLPQGLRITNQGQIVGVPVGLQAASKVKVTATDAGGLSVSQSLDISVWNTPTLQTVAPASGSKTLVKQGDVVQLVLNASEALILGGSGLPALAVEFNGLPLTAQFVGLNSAGNALTFSFTAPAKFGKSGLLAGDGQALRVLALDMNGSTLLGQTTGLPLETTAARLTTTAITLDNTEPASPGLQLVDLGVESSDGWSRATVVKVVGLEVDATWDYSLDSGNSWRPGPLLPHGAGPGFALNDEQRFAPGDVLVRQTDRVGNVSLPGSAQQPWVIDTTAPTLNLTSSTPALKAGESATLTLSFSEAPATLPLVTSPAGMVSAWMVGSSDTEYTATFTPGADFEGAAHFSLGAWYDRAGNLGSTQALASMAVDSRLPLAPSLIFSDTGWSPSDGVTATTLITLGQLQTDAAWAYSTNGGVDWTPGVGNSFNLTPGSYARGQVMVKQTDAAGNSSLTTRSPVHWQIDTSAPRTSIDSVAGDNVLNWQEREGGVRLSGRSAGAVPGDAVSVQWHGTSLETRVLADGTWAVGFSKGQLPSGELPLSEIRVSITDLAGNTSTIVHAVRVDTLTPSIALPTSTMPTDLQGWALNVTNAVTDNILNFFELTSITQTGEWQLSGTTTAEAGQDITLMLDGRSFKGSVSAGSIVEGMNTWTVVHQAGNQDVASVLAGLVHGNTYSLKVQGRDAAGNVSAWQESALQIKLFPPDVPTVAVLKTNSLTPVLSGTALKDTNTVDASGAKIYSQLEDGDLLIVTVAGRDFSLQLQASQNQNGPLSYDRSTQQWKLDLSAHRDSQGQALPLIQGSGVFDIGVQVKAAGYALPMADRSSQELMVKTISHPPVITWNPVAQDDVLNALETLAAVTLSGTVSDLVTGSPVNWAAGAALRVDLEVGGQIQTWGTTVNPDGTWSVQLTAAQAQALPSGSVRLSATVNSVFGNSATATRLFSVDTLAPTLTLNAPSDLALSAGETAAWQTALKVDDNGSGLGPVEAFLFSGSNLTSQLNMTQDADGNWVSVSGTWSVNSQSKDLTSLPDGNYTVHVVAKDLAGNSTMQSLSLVIDQTQPILSFEIHPAQLRKNQTAEVTLVLSESIAALPHLTPSQGSLSAWTAVPHSSGLRYKATLTPPDNDGGRITWTLAAWSDAAGNPGLGQAPAALDFDTVSPTVRDLKVVNPLPRPLGVNESVVVEVMFSEAVVIAGMPVLDLQVGTQTRSAVYAGVKTDTNNTPDPKLHLWRYTVQVGDNAADGIQISANALRRVDNASIQDPFGNEAVLTHAKPTIDSVLVDTTAPTVSVSLVGTDTQLLEGRLNISSVEEGLDIR